MAKFHIHIHSDEVLVESVKSSTGQRSRISRRRRLSRVLKRKNIAVLDAHTSNKAQVKIAKRQ